MATSPSTNIQLFRNVGIDPQHNHCIYFGSKAACDSYFTGRAVASYPSCSYQRQTPNKCRVQAGAVDLSDCTYMRWQNAAHGAFWFYAFVNRVDYVNDATAEIDFTIDNVNTYFWNCSMGQCYVEREHAVSDGIGDNVEPEEISVSRYRITEIGNFISVPTSVVVYSVDKTMSGSVLNGAFTGVSVQLFANVVAANAYIQTKVDEGKESEIIAAYRVPGFVAQDGIKQGAAVRNQAFSFNHSSIDGYTPRNNKLFTYPYSMLVCDNQEGSQLQLKLECFTPMYAPQAVIAGVMYPSPQVEMSFSNYNQTGSGVPNDQRLIIKDFPPAAFSGDSFAQYVAQNKTSMAIGALGAAAAGIVTTVATGGAALPAVLAAGGAYAFSTASKLSSAAQQPSQMHGSMGSGSINAAMNRTGFVLMHMVPYAAEAACIDDYFTAFGYACNRVKVPNISSRPSFNYVKCANARVMGNAPATAIRECEEMLNRGVTFWKQGVNMLDYSQDNAPVAHVPDEERGD